jgi:hypothetical protein
MKRLGNHLSSVVVIAVLLAFLLPVGLNAAGATSSADAQVTRGEYGKVKKGMSKAKVTTIVDASGKKWSRYAGCLVKEYTAWNKGKVYLHFENEVLTSKFRLTPGTVPVPCPTPPVAVGTASLR